MGKQRRQARAEQWRDILEVGAGLAVVGVIGKAAFPAGVVAALIGGLGLPVLLYVGLAVAVLGFGVWWAAAQTIARRSGLSTGNVMSRIWTVATWSFLGDLIDIL